MKSIKLGLAMLMVFLAFISNSSTASVCGGLETAKNEAHGSYVMALSTGNQASISSAYDAYQGALAAYTHCMGNQSSSFNGPN